MTSDNKDFVYHNYYMWVPYLLFFQSLTFFGPYLLHKFFQQGRLQLVIQELNNIWNKRLLVAGRCSGRHT